MERTTKGDIAQLITEEVVVIDSLPSRDTMISSEASIHYDFFYKDKQIVRQIGHINRNQTQ